MGFDPLTLLGTIAACTNRIAIGTGIVPTYPRHPTVLVSQVLAVAPFARDRLRVGLGSSHPFIIEGMLGLPFHRPIAHLREYLEVVRGLLEQGQVDFSGKYFRVNAALAGPPTRVPLPISAPRACSASPARSQTARLRRGVRSRTCSAPAYPSSRAARARLADRARR
jgi:alkanesulfonate monooxygenase SsuD/methylene tetrahydromethanopterin reductase-like flavin-dependent oxidoreductase (luciferase family)